jgi:hypothetical protein
MGFGASLLHRADWEFRNSVLDKTADLLRAERSGRP